MEAKMKKTVLLLSLVVFVLTIVPVCLATEKAETPEAVFASLDVDKDGKLVKEELCALFKDKEVCEEKFMLYDGDGDGYIVVEEFVEAHE